MTSKIYKAIIIIASGNAAALCFILAERHQGFSWYLFAMAIASLLILWLRVEHEY